jgi:hypothetical protein
MSYQLLGYVTLSARAGLPESVVDLFDTCTLHQFFSPRHHPERSGVAQLVHASPSIDEQASNTPTRVPNGVIQWRAVRN